jgi:hypothetical protein
VWFGSVCAVCAVWRLVCELKVESAICCVRCMSARVVVRRVCGECAEFVVRGECEVMLCE